MTLDIRKSTDPVEIGEIVVMVSGEPGSGKTTSAFTADTPLLLDFDQGAHRAANRGDSVPISQWDDVREMEEDDLAPYNTVVVDTVGRCLDVMSLDIISRNPKMQTRSGGLTLQGYGALKAGFASWMRKLRGFGLDVVLIAHTEEKRDGDTIIYRPEITGSSFAEVLKISDSVGYIHMVNEDRVLGWNPTDRYVGKNPAQLDETVIPHVAEDPDFFAGVIQDIKDALGSLSEEQEEVIAEVSEWAEEIEAVEAPDDLNELIAKINDKDTDIHESAKAQVKSLIARRAKESGWEWNGEAGGYVEGEE